MGKLIKYEFRKSLFSKLIFIGITLLMEIVFLVGFYGDYPDPLAIGALGLFFTALAGISYIGIESIIILYRDLTTKQSYMLFMTPNNSYKILGAKALQNAATVLLSGVFFGGLAAFDFSLLSKNLLPYKDILDMITTMLKDVDPRLQLNAKTLAAVLIMFLCAWVLQITAGYLAVVLSCTLLSGKKGAAIISFIIYIAVSSLINWVSNKIPAPSDPVPYLLVRSCIYLAWSAIMYFITAYLMDKKLSV